MEEENKINTPDQNPAADERRADTDSCAAGNIEPEKVDESLEKSQEETKSVEVPCDYVLRFRVPFGSHKRGDTNRVSGMLSEKLYNYDTLTFKYSDLLNAGIVEIISLVAIEK